MKNPASLNASAPLTGSTYWHLFKHMSDNHGLTLLESELEDICQAADKMRMERCGGVMWILINALYHLSPEQLNRLGEEIAKRSDATYTPNAEREQEKA